MYEYNMNVVLGTMNIHYAYSSNTNPSYEDYKNLIEKYIHYVGNKAILDTAYYYGNTTTEQVLGSILPELSILPQISTKVNPWYDNDFMNGHLGQLGKIALEKQFKTSLKNLGLFSVDYLFLHCYDYETALNETLEVCDDLWRKEKLKNFGIGLSIGGMTVYQLALAYPNLFDILILIAPELLHNLLSFVLTLTNLLD